MFDFPDFITILVTWFVFYFTLSFNYKKEIDDLKSESVQNTKTAQLKIYNRKKKMRFLNIITVSLVIVVTLLYLYPFLDNFDLTILSKITNFFSKILPFKKGFFTNANFKFSFITGLVLSIMIELVIFLFSNDIITPLFFFDYLLEIAILMISAISLIWADNYISIFLSYCVVHCFPFLSIVLNLLIYLIILSVIIIIYSIISSHQSKSGLTKESKS